MIINKKLFTIALVGILTAISTIIYMFFPEIQIVPNIPSMKLDLSDIPAALGAMVAGPFAGVMTQILKNIFHLSKTSSYGLGELINVILGSITFLSLSGFYRFFKRRTYDIYIPYVIASIITIIITVIGGWVTNLVFDPLYFKLYKMPFSMELYLTYVFGSTTLNAVKSIFTCALTFPIFVAVRQAFKKSIFM